MQFRNEAFNIGGSILKLEGGFTILEAGFKIGTKHILGQIEDSRLGRPLNGIEERELSTNICGRTTLTS